MEKAFVATKESKYYQDKMKYNELLKQQKKDIGVFFIANGIEAEEYYIRGNGCVNCAFTWFSRKLIRLRIVPTKNDFDKFSNQLSKGQENWMLFKSNSKISRLFKDYAVENGIIINLRGPSLYEYFKSISIDSGYGYHIVELDDCIYIKIDSDTLEDDDIPEGMKEIKISEFYRAIEEYESKK